MDLFGYGARGIAMGGTIASTAQGHEAVYYNPAGLVASQELSFAIGFQRGSFDLEIGGREHDALAAPAITLGFGVPLPFRGALEDRVALGLGFVLPQTSILIADTPKPGEPQFPLLENRAQTVSILGAGSVRIVDGLSIGAGFLALSELEGAIDVAPRDSGQIGSSVKDQLVVSYAPIIGLAARPHPRIALGLVWHGESRADYELPISADLGDSFPLPVPNLDIAGTAQFDPAQLAGDVTGEVVQGLRVAVGATWKRWSRFPNPIVYTAVPDCYPTQPGPRFSDVVVPQLGAEWERPVGDIEIAARSGIRYESSPVPEQTGLHNYLDSDRLVTSAGVGAAYRRVRLDAAVQWHRAGERTHVKAGSTEPPGEGDGGGDTCTDLAERVPPTFPESNPGAPSIVHQASIVLFGVELGVSF